MSNFYLRGDLCQMAEQKKFLRQQGFEVSQVNVYPTIMLQDVYKVLLIIWLNKVEGWWHYEDKYIEHDICTKEEFKNGFQK